MNLKSSKIYIAGHNGMVGSSLYRVLNDKGYNNLIGVSSKKLDLTNQSDVIDFFNKEKPDIVINAAGKVGGIKANINNPYQFLLKNLQIQNNLVELFLNFDYFHRESLHQKTQSFFLYDLLLFLVQLLLYFSEMTVQLIINMI